MQVNCLKFVLAATLAGGLFPFAAEAATITIGSASNQWESITAAAGVTDLNGLGTDTIRWGKPAETAQSGYRFAHTGTGIARQAGQIFDIGSFTHFNNPIYGDSVSGAKLSLDYSLLFDGRQSTTINRSIVMDFAHLETRNKQQTCDNGQSNGTGVNRNGCADRVKLLTAINHSEKFVVDGITYILEILGFTPGTDFWTVEGQTNTTTLQARFTTQQELTEDGGGKTPSTVPLPAAGWLLLAALGLLRVGARARKASA
ncbi:MAG: THxN family PEP-CTERM protein [Paracoccaceae bacterium]|nr:THxN family PEP-CTERM protein [Paracoccaceae bacterium]